ncbi:MAG: protein-export chaperone SecB [Rhodospirillaceae bacterium]|nr:MAG: protein-export chaperone SecB [Rhodospirillaceae bacterium]
MSEDAPSAADSTPSQGVSPVRLVGQYIKDLSFEVPGAPQIFSAVAQAPVNLSVSVNVRSHHAGESTYEVTLQFHIGATTGEHTAFLIELSYGCIVMLDETVIPQDQIHPLLHIEVPRLMFPFPRQIISDLCAQGGFPQLMLQIIDFGELYAKRYGIAMQNAEPVEAPPTIN